MLRKRSAEGVARRLLAALAVLAAVVLVLDGCGSRGALEGSTDEADAAPEAEAATPEEAAAPEDASLLDAGREGGGILACGACVLETCGQSIFACFQSEGCRAIFGCVASECLGGGPGGLDPGCLIGCAGSDPASVLQVLNIFQCVTQQCGADCSSILGGLGRGGGGGIRDAGGGIRDAGGGGRDAGGGIRDAGVGEDGGRADDREAGGDDDAGDEP
jgi:predicted small lipoprotein YifL